MAGVGGAQGAARWLLCASAAPQAALATGRVQVRRARHQAWLWGAGTHCPCGKDASGQQAGRFSASWEVSVGFALGVRRPHHPACFCGII